MTLSTKNLNFCAVFLFLLKKPCLELYFIAILIAFLDTGSIVCCIVFFFVWLLFVFKSIETYFALFSCICLRKLYIKK